MNKYFCTKCNIEVETSECPICKERTLNQNKIFWCEELNIPVINDDDYKDCYTLKYIGNDIRPVFPEERLLIELILGRPLKYLKSSCWCVSGGKYIIDGKTVRIVVKNLGQINDEKFREEFNYYLIQNNDNEFEKYKQLFVQYNGKRYNYLTTEAMNYINEKVEAFDFNSTFVSFSGGKDSTVVSDLVRRALGTPKIIHIFGDTTLEFPETYEYVKRFKLDNRLTPMLNAKNKEKNFYDMCEVVGPPSRVMRWCCTVFKTGAITQYINAMYKNKSRILTFYGIRRSESTSRSKYDRESDSPKITKQHTISPIIDWLDVDVWLYLLTRDIDFNEAYRYGFSRVGCWCCPNNSSWSEFLSKIHHPDDFYRFRDILLKNATKIGKPDPEEYVDSGAWKAKQGGDGLDYSKKRVISFTPCATEENAFNYQLQKPVDKNFFELLKPFGTLNYDLGNSRLGEVYILNRKNQVIMKVQAKLGDMNVKVSIINLPLGGARNMRDAERKVQCQLTKFQMCLNCSACMSVCRFGAIKIKYEDGVLDYKIDESRCVHCNECINHFTSGCYLRKVLATKD